MYVLIYCLAISEFVHFITHFIVFTQLHQPSSLLNDRWALLYFTWDGLSSLAAYLTIFTSITSFAYHIFYVAVIGAHLLYYVPCWGRHYYACRIKQWSLGKLSYFSDDWIITAADVVAHLTLFFRLLDTL